MQIKGINGFFNGDSNYEEVVRQTAFITSLGEESIHKYSNKNNY